MATDTTTPAKVVPQGDPDRPVSKVIPAVLLVLLVSALVTGVWYLIRTIMNAESVEGQDVKFVFRRLEESVRLFGKERDAKLFWIPVLIVTLTVGMGYACWMYVRDGKQVGWLWATFLGSLRCSVYLLLAGIFLLPALQTWEKSEAVSRVLVLLDLSGSMNLSDDLPTDGQTPVTRLDQVRGLFTGENGAFFKALQEKNPVYVYGFGGRLDEDFREFKKTGPQWSEDDWKAWMKLDPREWIVFGFSEEGQQKIKASRGFSAEISGSPAEWAVNWFKETDVAAQLNPDDLKEFEKKKETLLKKLEARQQVLSSTNYGDSLLAAANREANNMVAGLIVIGDGQSNQGSESTFEEFRRRIVNAKIPVFTVAVGEAREQINIKITDLQAPEQAPPDEKFLIGVEVDGEGLPDKDFDCFLDFYKPGLTPGKDKPSFSMPNKGKFKAAGGLPHGRVDFIIDAKMEALATLLKDKSKPEFEEGEWKFVARVPKAKGEAFNGKEHVSDIPASVQIVKRPLRVLLFAGGPTRDYQFARRLFVNEMDKKRAEVSICLQVTDPKGDRVQDVPPERLIKQFPNYFEDKKEGDKAEDRFYNLAQYDLIVCFDPDWTQVPPESLARLEEWVRRHKGGLIFIGGPINTYQLARGTNFEKLKPIIDMYPVKVEDSRLSGLGVERSTTKPWQLNFPGASAETEFLKLDDESKYPLAGWSEFFYGKAYNQVQPSDQPIRGIYTYYPVKSIKQGATAVATFGDPAARLTGDAKAGEEQPYLVTMPYGGGKVVYISSGEMWRLRLFKENFHERFWTKLARYAGSGAAVGQSRRGQILVAKQFTAGQYVSPVVQLYQANGQPLAKNAEPRIKVVSPSGESNTAPSYKLEAKREGDWEGYFNGRFLVSAPGKYQLELAVPGSNEILRRDFYVKESNPEIDNVRPNLGRLYDLASSVGELRVNDQLKTDLKRKLRQTPKPADAGVREEAPGKEGDPHLFFDVKNARMIPEFLSSELKIQRTRGPIQDLWSEGPTLGEYNGKPVVISTVLMVVVGLLSIEWLSRKLLKLA